MWDDGCMGAERGWERVRDVALEVGLHPFVVVIRQHNLLRPTSCGNNPHHADPAPELQHPLPPHVHLLTRHSIRQDQSRLLGERGVGPLHAFWWDTEREFERRGGAEGRDVGVGRGGEAEAREGR